MDSGLALRAPRNDGSQLNWLFDENEIHRATKQSLRRHSGLARSLSSGSALRGPVGARPGMTTPELSGLFEN
jgi:hypothetical protein